MSDNCLENATVNGEDNSEIFQQMFHAVSEDNSQNKIQFLLVTDPICSTAWSFEGEIKRLLLEYGHVLDFRVIMGGLLPSWIDFDRGGINKASDVFCHWRDVGDHYSVPLSAEVWRKDPLSSSFPASKAVICAFIQGKELGLKLLRRLREAVFIFDQNISKLDILIEKAESIGLDLAKFLDDYENKASFILEDEINKAKALQVKLMPSVIFTQGGKEQYKLEANLDYECMEAIIHMLRPETYKQDYDKNILSLMNRFNSLSTKEISILAQQSRSRTNQQLNQMKELGLIDVMEFPSGNFWIKKG
jgi:putative protein-disulfide isomerase